MSARFDLRARDKRLACAGKMVCIYLERLRVNKGGRTFS